MNKHIEVLTLLQELQQLGTVNRIFTYGPIDTLGLAVSRLFNKEIYNFFNDYLELLDETCVFFNSTKYIINIDRYTLGELYNVSRLETAVDPENDTSENFFKIFFNGLNNLIFEILKAGIDELYNNDNSLENVSSLRGLASLDYESKHYNYIKDIIIGYLELFSAKPYGISLFSYLKRYKINTNFIVNIVDKLEEKIINYIKLKYSINKNSTLSVFQTK